MPDDSFAAINPRQALGLVIVFSLVAYVIAANLLGRRRANRLDRQPASRRGRSEWGIRTVAEIARWSYYLGVPYATLLLGYNTVRALGVWNLDWLDPLVYGATLGVGAIAVFIWVWRPYAKMEYSLPTGDTWNTARHALELIYQQAHWAFYRSGPILLLGDVYWGSFAGLGLVFLEGWSNPEVRTSIRDFTRADAPLWTGSLAIVTTVVFVFTQNTWYCLLIHSVIDLWLRGFIGFPVSSEQLDDQSMTASPVSDTWD